MALTTVEESEVLMKNWSLYYNSKYRKKQDQNREGRDRFNFKITFAFYFVGHFAIFFIRRKYSKF